jgi:hypothetical protein
MGGAVCRIGRPQSSKYWVNFELKIACIKAIEKYVKFMIKLQVIRLINGEYF